MERYPSNQLLELLSRPANLDRLKAALKNAERSEVVDTMEPSPSDTRATSDPLEGVIDVLRQVADGIDQSTRDVAAYARTEAHELVEEIVPAGTKRNDDITLSRQALENEIARALVLGYKLGTAGSRS